MRYTTFGTFFVVALSAMIHAAPIPSAHSSITLTTPPSSEAVRLERRVINQATNLDANDHNNEKIKHEALREGAKNMAALHRSAAATNKNNQELALARQEAHSGSHGDGEAFERAEQKHKEAANANEKSAQYFEDLSKYHDHAAKYHEYSAKGTAKGWHAEVDKEEMKDTHLGGQVTYSKAAALHKAAALKMSDKFPHLAFQHDATPPSSPPPAAAAQV